MEDSFAVGKSPRTGSCRVLSSLRYIRMRGCVPGGGLLPAGAQWTSGGSADAGHHIASLATLGRVLPRKISASHMLVGSFNGVLGAPDSRNQEGPCALLAYRLRLIPLAFRKRSQCHCGNLHGQLRTKIPGQLPCA